MAVNMAVNGYWKRFWDAFFNRPVPVKKLGRDEVISLMATPGVTQLVDRKAISVTMAAVANFFGIPVVVAEEVNANTLAHRLEADQAVTSNGALQAELDAQIAAIRDEKAIAEEDTAIVLDRCADEMRLDEEILEFFGPAL